MRKNTLVVAFMLILVIWPAYAGVEEQVNYFFLQNGYDIQLSLDNKNIEAYTSLEDNLLKVSKGGKELALDLESFRNGDSISSMSIEFRPNKITISADETPKIIFLNNEEIFSVEQIENGMTKIIFGQAKEETDVSSLFVVEHYTPDKVISDASRKQGASRLAIISKNNPLVRINNNGIDYMPETSSISTRSFFSSDLDKSEIDVLGKEKLQIKELIGFPDSLLFRISSFSFDMLFDRGYKTEIVSNQEENIKGFDVTPALCSKLGFVFAPGYGYDFINAAEDFTNHNGWVMGIAYTEKNNLNTSLEDMRIFLEKANENNLTHIVRIDDENSDASLVSDFINTLYNISEGKLEYVQLGNKPNAKDITPEEYAGFVANVKKDIFPEIKIISAAIMPDENSKEYFSSLLDYSDFGENIDYLGAYAYDMNISDENFNYKMQLELLKKKTGKSFEAIITEAGYPPEEKNYWKTHQLLQSFKEDKNVKAALIYVANSWQIAPEDSWLNEDSSMTPFAEKISNSVCN